MKRGALHWPMLLPVPVVRCLCGVTTPCGGSSHSAATPPEHWFDRADVPHPRMPQEMTDPALSAPMREEKDVQGICTRTISTTPSARRSKRLYAAFINEKKD